MLSTMIAAGLAAAARGSRQGSRRSAFGHLDDLERDLVVVFPRRPPSVSIT
jgi:hypothetical protein